MVNLNSDTFTKFLHHQNPIKYLKATASHRDASHKSATHHQPHHYHHSQPCVHARAHELEHTLFACSYTASPTHRATHHHHHHPPLPDSKQQPNQAAESRNIAKRKTAKTTSRKDTDGQERSQRPDNYQKLFHKNYKKMQL